MALKKCKNCGKTCSVSNKFCDGCGGELEVVSEKKKGVVRYIIGGIIIFLGVNACFNSNYFTGITLILLGVSLFPVIYDTLLSNVKVKYLYVFVPLIFFALFVVLNPVDDKIRESIRDKEKISQYKEFSWPSSDIAKLIPIPKSNKGKISWEKSDGFYIEVSDTSFSDYNDYVDACKDNGFTLDYSKGDDYYYSYNDSGYKLSLNYDEDYEVMKISMSAPKEDDGSNVKPDETDKPTTNTGVRPDVKEFLDSYESVMNEYVDFMKKYKDSNYSSNMLTDYLKILDKYTDFVDKIDAVDESEYNDEELKYYLDVTSRVTKKLKDLV